MSKQQDAYHDLTVAERIGPRLKVWWIPQVPMQPFAVLVNSLAEAKAILETLALYDAFQFENNIKPDYSNAGGLCVQAEDGDWEDWETDDGESIDDLSLSECATLDREFYDSTLRANVVS